MKKLKLQPDDLAVESFPTAAPEGSGGTVEGREAAPTYPYPGCPIGTKPTDCPCTPMY